MSSNDLKFCRSTAHQTEGACSADDYGCFHEKPFNYGVNYFEEGRKQVLINSLLLSEAWIFPTMMAGYITFIFFGIRLMQKRNPYHLKFQMLAFNIFQICYNWIMFCRVTNQRFRNYYVDHICHPMDPSKNELWPEAIGVVHMFFVSKQIDLIDTVFLVLRKKTQQISLLHLYHHISMATLAWLVMKYNSSIGEQLNIVITLNSMIHVMMYSYYLLSLMGTSIRQYLSWKKYVTMAQLVQFGIYIVYMATLLVFGCTHPKDMSMLILFQAVMFFVLFSNFYDKQYIQRLS